MQAACMEAGHGEREIRMQIKVLQQLLPAVESTRGERERERESKRLRWREAKRKRQTAKVESVREGRPFPGKKSRAAAAAGVGHAID